MAELHETMYGKKLLEHDIPEIHRQLKRIADTLELLLTKEEETNTYKHLESLKRRS